MNSEKLGAALKLYAGGDAKQAIGFAWPKNISGISPSVSM